MLRGDRGITYSATPPENSEITAGEWWPASYEGEPLVTFGDEITAGPYRLEVGDTVTVNVLGREVTARIASLRTINWQSLSINWVTANLPGRVEWGALHQPRHPHLSRRRNRRGGTHFLKAVVAAFPAVTVIRVKEAIETANGIVEQIGWAVRGASAITLTASMLVLGGAFAAGRRRRTEDAVILKTLGATRGRLIAAFSIEFLLLGAATVIFGLIAGAIAAWFVLRSIMDVPFAFLPGPALGAAFVALALTLVFGLAGTWRVLGQKAAPVLRNL